MHQVAELRMNSSSSSMQDEKRDTRRIIGNETVQQDVIKWVKKQDPFEVAESGFAALTMVFEGGFQPGHLGEAAKAVGLDALSMASPLLGMTVSYFMGLFETSEEDTLVDHILEQAKRIVRKAIFQERTVQTSNFLYGITEVLQSCCISSDGAENEFMKRQLDKLLGYRRNTFGSSCYSSSGADVGDCKEWQTSGGGSEALFYGIMHAQLELQIWAEIAEIHPPDRADATTFIQEHGKQFWQLLDAHYKNFMEYRLQDNWFEISYHCSGQSGLQHQCTYRKNKDTYSGEPLDGASCGEVVVGKQYWLDEPGPFKKRDDLDTTAKACVDSTKEAIKDDLRKEFEGSIKELENVWNAPDKTPAPTPRPAPTPPPYSSYSYCTHNKIMPNTPDNNVPGVRMAGTREACIQACLSNPSCVAISWRSNIPYDACYMKKQWIPAAAVTSPYYKTIQVKGNFRNCASRGTKIH